MSSCVLSTNSSPESSGSSSNAAAAGPGSAGDLPPTYEEMIGMGLIGEQSSPTAAATNSAAATQGGGTGDSSRVLPCLYPTLAPPSAAVPPPPPQQIRSQSLESAPSPLHVSAHSPSDEHLPPAYDLSSSSGRERSEEGNVEITTSTNADPTVDMTFARNIAKINDGGSDQDKNKDTKEKSKKNNDTLKYEYWSTGPAARPPPQPKSSSGTSIDRSGSTRSASSRIERKLLEEGKKFTKVTTSLDNLDIVSDYVGDDDEDLFNPPPKQECPLCFLPLPNEDDGRCYLDCCGKMICFGCTLKHDAVLMWSNYKRAAKDLSEPLIATCCSFCRRSEEEMNETGYPQRINERVTQNDPAAVYQAGCCYTDGSGGFPRDERKGIELFHRAAELGSPEACWNLACRYSGKDHSKYMHYIKLGAKRGDVDARYKLGLEELGQGKFDLAVRHWMISAAAGDSVSLHNIGVSFKKKCATKDQYEEAIRTYQKAKQEMSSFERDMAQKYCNGGKFFYYEFDPSVFSEAELAKLFGVRESERMLFSRFYEAAALHEW